MITRHRRPRLSDAVQALPITQAIARVRLAPGLGCREFEQRLRIIPAVRSAVSVVGDVDYEIWLASADLEFGFYPWVKGYPRQICAGRRNANATIR